jgi:hypothetical protein
MSNKEIWEKENTKEREQRYAEESLATTRSSRRCGERRG